ncbi:MAG: PSD1 and planctomycete cytochrome C domain-containing protein [Fuerstiella sp.]
MPSNGQTSLLLVFCVLTTTAAATADDSKPVFESDIRPILQHRCGKCHSDKVQKGALNLSDMEGVRRGGESGKPAVVDSLDESLLWIMVEGGDMPPEGQPPLTDSELALIRRWISTGATSETPHAVTARAMNQHDVLPILLLRCAACHGAQVRQGDLDLRSVAAARKGGRRGPAFVPGDPDASLMIQRIETEACPPRELLLKFFVRRPPSAEVTQLRDWIAAGAPVVDVSPDVATTEPDPLVTDQDRQHWAFQPPAIVEDAASADDFVLRKLSEHGLTFSPEADRDTLIRRAYLDLIGLPPAPDEWKRWRTSSDSDWHAQMIDHLLESPHYGERWGRYWLDLAGYADSEGGVSADPVRENAWKYRDYVIRSFNSDKPYDQFLVQQIAGDELVDYEQAPVITEQMVENLTATGFLRMGIDQTGSRTMNFVPERLGVIGDAIAVLGSGVLGLTLECAKCHSHKYDAIPHRDYYRFKAIFQGALDEHDWLSFRNRSLQIDTPERRQRVAQVNPPLVAEIKKLQGKLRKAVTELQLETLRQHYPTQSEADNEKTVAALRIADNNRTLPQRLLVEKLQRAELVAEAEQPPPVRAARQTVQQLEQQIADVRRRMEPSLKIRALWDRGDPSPTYILRRGEHDKPGPLVGPGVPSVLTDGRTPFVIEPPFPDGTPKTGRRLAFARWLTRPDHPLTARVLVNRIWYHHFGQGLVRSLENFGVKGEPPTHPELLDWLAVRFVQDGFSIKSLHRRIMNTRTWRQSSRVTSEHLQRDPDNKLLSRMPLRRMDAEALRDSLLFVSDALDPTPFGPPDPVTVDRDGLVSADATSPGRWRRSIYVQYRRTEIPTLMETFDYPEMGPNCVARTVSTVSPQPLMLMNNQRIRQLAASLAARVKAMTEIEAKDSAALFKAQVKAVCETALSRPPDDDETRLGMEALQSLRDYWNDQPDAALETYCHIILNSATFVYID